MNFEAEGAIFHARKKYFENICPCHVRIRIGSHEKALDLPNFVCSKHFLTALILTFCFFLFSIFSWRICSVTNSLTGKRFHVWSCLEFSNLVAWFYIFSYFFLLYLTSKHPRPPLFIRVRIRDEIPIVESDQLIPRCEKLLNRSVRF